MTGPDTPVPASEQRKRSYVLLVSVLGNVATLLLAIGVTVRINDSTEHKFCATFAAITTAPRPEPGNERAASVTRSLADLAHELHCPTSGGK